MRKFEKNGFVFCEEAEIKKDIRPMSIDDEDCSIGNSVLVDTGKTVTKKKTKLIDPDGEVIAEGFNFDRIVKIAESDFESAMMELFE